MWTDQLLFEGGGVAFSCSAGNLDNDTFLRMLIIPRSVVPEGTLFGKKEKTFSLPYSGKRLPPNPTLAKAFFPHVTPTNSLTPTLTA